MSYALHIDISCGSDDYQAFLKLVAEQLQDVQARLEQGETSAKTIDPEYYSGYYVDTSAKCYKVQAKRTTTVETIVYADNPIKAQNAMFKLCCDGELDFTAEDPQYTFTSELASEEDLEKAAE